MQPSAWGESRYTAWPYLLLPLSSGVFGLWYLLYLFDVAPALLQVVPRSQLMFLTSQLAIALFAVYLVVIFVDTAQRESQAADRQRRQEAAMNQLTTVLEDHLTMLVAWHVASQPEPSAEPPQQYATFFNETYLDSVARLDFAAPVGAGRSQSLTWLAWSAAKLETMNEEIASIIELYGDAFDPAVIEQLHALANSRLGRHLRTAEEAELTAHVPEESALVLMAESPNSDALAGHLDVVIEILETHDELGSSPVTPLDELSVWDDETHPTAGGAQAGPEAAESEPYYKFV